MNEFLHVNSEGRVLCPGCKAPMYMTVCETYHGLPAFFNVDEGEFSYCTWDCRDQESDVEQLVCHCCSLTVHNEELWGAHFVEP